VTRLILAVALVVSMFGPVAAARLAAGPAGAMFTDITRAAGLAVRNVNGASPEKFLVETMGSGALFLDYDNDDWPDVFLVDGGSLADPRVAAQARHRLFRNRHDGTFEDRTAASGIRIAGYGMGTCAADFDNDGFVDLYVTAYGGNTLYRNTGNGVFRDVTRSAGVAAGEWSTSCAFADFDRDGKVDLFVTRYVNAGPQMNPFCGDPARKLRVYCHPLNFKGLSSIVYRNNGNGSFTDVSAESGVAAVAGNGLGVVVADYDNDGLPDVFVANDAVPNFLFHNDGRWRFTESGLAAGVSVARDGKPRAGMGTDFGDLDGDGDLDLVVTNHEFETHSIFRNDGSGLFTDATVQSGIGPATLPFVGFGTVFLDYDNDGQLDLAIVNGHVIDNTALFRAGSTHKQRNLLFHNTGGLRLADVSRSAGPGFTIEKVSRALVAADVDDDGDLDLLVTNNGDTPDLLRNDSVTGHALLVRLEGVRSNRQGIGARVWVTAGAKRQLRDVKAGSSYLGQNDTRVHVGLGAATAPVTLEIDWPSGQREVVPGVGVDQLVVVREAQGIRRVQPLRRVQ
jgi:hypothetical protein